MDFADQTHKPKQTFTSQPQSISLKKPEPTPKELTNGVNYDKMPKALQNSPLFGFGGPTALERAEAQRQLNAALPKRTQQLEPKQSAAPTSQNLPLEGSKTPLSPLVNGVDYGNILKALQNSPVFGLHPAPLQAKVQGQANAGVPRQEQTPQSELVAAAPHAALSTAAPKPIQIAQETKGTATPDSGKRALAGKAFNKFLRQQLKKRSPELAAKVLGASVADGPFPIGEALSLSFTVQAFYDIYQDYVKLYPPQADPSETFSPTQSQPTPAGGTHSTHKQAPINLGTVPQMGTSTNDPVDAFLKAQEAQIQQSDRQMAAKHQREAQLALSADSRQRQRNAIDTAMGDKLYKVDAQENLSLYQTWLLQNDPKFLDKMNRQSGARYDALTNQGKDLEVEGAASRQSLRKNLLSHTMYQNDLRAREMIEYSSMELNLGQVTNQGTGFNQKKLAQIRGNFDAVMAGGYEKKLEPKVIKYAETQANAAYVKETGSKEVDRNSPLWKTMRNVELLKYDRTLWNTV
jgi:hypothetical protein